MNSPKVFQPHETGKPRFFYGYIVVASAFTIQLLVWGIYNTFGVFIEPFEKEFHWSRASISGAVSLNYLLYGFFSILVGHLNDRFGPRILMTACGVLLGVGYFLISQVDSIFQLYLFFSLLVAMGLSGCDVILLSTAARWFAKKRGVMTGIIKVGTGVGMVIMPMFISWLITGYGWRITFMVLGILLLVSVLPLAQFLVGDPAVLGQLSDGEKNPTAENSTLPEPGLTLAKALATRQLWMVCLVSLLILFCVFTILVHIVPHAIDLGISASRAASILALMGAASIAGRLFMGSASDRFGSRIALSLCFLLMISGLVCLQFAKELSVFYVFAVAHGVAHGGFFSLLSPTTAALFGTRSHGVLFGIVIFSGTLGGFIGPVFAGYVFDITHSYQVVFLTLTILSMIGLLSSITLRPSVGAGLQQKQSRLPDR